MLLSLACPVSADKRSVHSGQVANTVIFSGLLLSLSLTLNFRQN